jgi:hypothetical protein
MTDCKELWDQIKLKALEKLLITVGLYGFWTVHVQCRADERGSLRVTATDSSFFDCWWQWRQRYRSSDPDFQRYYPVDISRDSLNKDNQTSSCERWWNWTRQWLSWFDYNQQQQSAACGLSPRCSILAAMLWCADSRSSIESLSLRYVPT